MRKRFEKVCDYCGWSFVTEDSQKTRCDSCQKYLPKKTGTSNKVPLFAGAKEKTLWDISLRTNVKRNKNPICVVCGEKTEGLKGRDGYYRTCQNPKCKKIARQKALVDNQSKRLYEK